MSEVSASSTPAGARIESPPPSPQPIGRSSPDDDARGRLHRLAMQLIRTRNRRLLAEFLTLRRAMR